MPSTTQLLAARKEIEIQKQNEERLAYIERIKQEVGKPVDYNIENPVPFVPNRVLPS